MNKKILFVDMDNVLVDFQSGIDRLDAATRKQYENKDWKPGDKAKDKYKDIDDCPGLFALMEPIHGAVDALKKLHDKYDIYVLSTAPWKNPTALNDKLAWIKKYFNPQKKGDLLYKKLIFTHHKDMCQGDYLIDDRTSNGAGDFKGTLIQFNPDSDHITGKDVVCKNWGEVLAYLIPDK